MKNFKAKKLPPFAKFRSHTNNKNFLALIIPYLSYSSHISRQHQLSWYLVGSDDDLEVLAHTLPAGGEDQ